MILVNHRVFYRRVGDRLDSYTHRVYVDENQPIFYDQLFLFLYSAFEYLKDEIWKSSELLKKLFPDGVTMPELHNLYCKILCENLDRRNFRKKMLADGFVQDSGKMKQEKGKKPSIIYWIK